MFNFIIKIISFYFSKECNVDTCYWATLPGVLLFKIKHHTSDQLMISSPTYIFFPFSYSSPFFFQFRWHHSLTKTSQKKVRINSCSFSFQQVVITLFRSLLEYISPKSINQSNTWICVFFFLNIFLVIIKPIKKH